MDAENYAKLPLSQYEEDNFLRELNKSLLAFRQRFAPPPPPTTRRLSPIGESFSSTPPEIEETTVAKPTTATTLLSVSTSKYKFV